MKPLFKICATSLTAIKRIRAQLKLRFKNAGGVYNYGNLVAEAGAIFQVIETSDGTVNSAVREVLNLFAGNLPVAAVTAGVVCFFIGGEKYYRAWSNGFPPDEQKNNQGHLWSAAGAGFMAAGLMGLSPDYGFSFWSAAIGGTAHVGGKLGSVYDPKRDRLYKLLPLFSRIPGMLSPANDIRIAFNDYDTTGEAVRHSILPGFMMGGCLCWGRADIMLMPPMAPVRKAINRIIGRLACGAE